MNTMHLAYAVEVERCGSITQAAENLYMAQPNLSKAIKELEESMGFAIFARTSRGVIPTARGQEFLGYARAILSQVQKMEALSGRAAGSSRRFSLAAPPDGVVASCAAQLVSELDPDRPADICIREAGTAQAVSLVAEGQLQLAIVRCTPAQEQALLPALTEKNLSCEALREDDALVLFSARHPLADARRITATDLAPYPALTADDAPQPRPASGRMQIAGRLQQMELLSRLSTAYLWSAPESAQLLRRFDLVQRPCADSGLRFRELLISPAGYQLSAYDRRFLELLGKEREQLSRACGD